MAIAAAAAVAAIAALWLWRLGPPGEGSGGRRPGAVDAPPAALVPDLPERALSVENVRHNPMSIEFRLERRKLGAAAAAAGPVPDEKLVFCVPPGVKPRAQVASLSVEGEARLPAAESGATTEALTLKTNLEAAIAVKELGILRRWRLVGVELKPEFWNAARAPRGEADAALSAELALAWDEPFTQPTEPPFPNELEGAAGWGFIAGQIARNPEGLRLYQMADPELGEGIAPKKTAPWHFVPGERRWARLRLAEEGLYELQTGDLSAVGFPSAEIKPADVRVFSRGAAVPVLRRGAAGAEKIYLWNDSIRTSYSRERIYWVTLAPDLPDEVIPAADAAGFANRNPRRQTTTTRKAILDRDNELQIESGTFMEIEMMEWVDAPIPPGGDFALPLQFPGYAAPDGPLEAKMRFYVSREDESARLERYNLTLKRGEGAIGPLELAPNQRSPEVEQTLPIPPQSISEGAVEFALHLEPYGAGAGAAPIAPPTAPAPGSTLWFNRIEIAYPSRPILIDGALSLHDVPAAPGGPVWTPLAEPEAAALEGAFILALGPNERPLASLAVSSDGAERGILWPGGAGHRVEVRAAGAARPAPRFESVQLDDLAREDNGADYLVIAHREFMGLDLLKPLADLHAREGKRVRMADVQSVYDNFSDGELSPEAIRALLAHTLGHWRGGAASYVLLVGDASSDYLGKAKNNVKNWVPTYTYDFRGDKWASDHWFSTVAGRDDLAEFLLGRISVENRKDAETIVAKIAGYAEGAKFGPSRARAAFIADDGEFPGYVEGLKKEHTPVGFEPARVYLDEKMPLEDNWYLEQAAVAAKQLKVSPVATAKIIDAFRNGAAFLEYYGHGSPNLWMDERVWYGAATEHSDNRHLEGSGYLSFVTNMTCNTGSIDYPVPLSSGVNICISEDLMRVKDGGAIALFVPSGPSVTPIHQKMSIELHRAMFESRARRFGDIAALARTTYTLAGHPEQLTYMFILLGDPALEFQMTRDAFRFEPPAKIARPGETLALKIAAAKPAIGKFSASLETESGEELWRSDPAAFAGGAIPLEIPIPELAPEGGAFLRVYAWDEKSKSDFAAGAEIQIEKARLLIERASLKRSADGVPGAEVVLANGGKGEISDGRLYVAPIAEGNGAARSEERKIALAGEARTTLTLALAPPDPGGDAPALYELRAAARPAAGEHPAPSASVKRMGIAPREDWTRLVPALGSWDNQPDGQSAKLEVVALSGAPKAASWILGIDDQNGALIRSQPLTIADGEGRTALTFTGPERDRATTATLWLAELGVSLDKPGARASEIKTSELRRIGSRLRIVPGSVEIGPDDPMDGQTIFVKLRAENIGEAATPAFSAALFDGDPDAAGRPLPARLAPPKRREDPLAPGDSREILLRWDPFQNAGEQTLWAGLDPGIRPKGANAEELKSEVKIRVRTKADLRLGATSMDTGDAGGGKKQLYITGEVYNRGESDARNVVVVFYKSGIKIPENQLGEVTLPIIRAQSKETARLLVTESLQLKKENPPTHEARLKGSRQRVTRLNSGN